MAVEGAAVSLAASLVSGVFAGLVSRQYLRGRKASMLAWTVGLAMFAVASFSQFLAEVYGWSADLYKLYYVLAAVLVAVLGIGSAFLVHRRLGLGFTAYTAVLAAGFLFAVLTAQVNLAELEAPIPAGSGMPDSVRIYSPLFTIPGSIALIGIAAYSYWRARIPFALWIGAGAAVVAAGGALSRLNIPWALYAAELLGISMMFWGFLGSARPAGASRTTKARAALR